MYDTVYDFFLWIFFSLRTGGKVSLQGNMDPCALYATKVSIGIYKHQTLLKLESFAWFQMYRLSKLKCFVLEKHHKILLTEFQNKEALLFLQIQALLVTWPVRTAVFHKEPSLAFSARALKHDFHSIVLPPPKCIFPSSFLKLFGCDSPAYFGK